MSAFVPSCPRVHNAPASPALCSRTVRAMATVAAAATRVATGGAA